MTNGWPNGPTGDQPQSGNPQPGWGAPDPGPQPPVDPAAPPTTGSWQQPTGGQFDQPATPPATGGWPQPQPSEQPGGNYAAPADPQTWQQPTSGQFDQPATPPATGGWQQPQPSEQPGGGYAAPADPQTWQQPTSGQFDQPATPPATGGWPQPATEVYGQPTAQWEQQAQPAADNPWAQPAAVAAVANPWDAPAAAAPATSRKKKNRMWAVAIAAIAAIAVAATVFFVVTGDPGVKSGDNEVTNASEFASEQTDAWKQSLPSKGVTQADDAQCYYVADEASEEVTSQLACGPVRRPDKSEEEVWDILDYTLDSGASGRVTATIDSPIDSPDAATQRSQKLPVGTILITGDGQIAEASGAGLKEPEVPEAPANTLWTSDMFTVDDADKGAALAPGGETTIAGLGTQYTVDSIVEVSKATIDATIAKAPAGQKLYVISLSSSDAPNPWSGSNELSFTLGDQQQSAPLTGANLTYLASAPEGGPLQMVLTSAGKAQTLDLLTGQRTGDTYTEVLYTDGSPKTSSPGTTAAIPRITDSAGILYDITVSVDSVETEVFDGSAWAPDGQVFVTVELSSEGASDSPVPVYYSFDCSPTTANEGQVSCATGNLGTATVTGTVSAGGQLTLNFAGQILVALTPTGAGSPASFTTTTLTIPLPS